MSKYIKVAVSPFYNGMGWIDEETGITFRSTGLLNTYMIEKKLGFKLEGIQKQILLNNLILLEGDFETEYVPEDLDGLKSEIQSLQGDNERLNNQNSTLEGQVESLGNEISQLEAQVANLEAQLADALGDGIESQSTGEPDSSLYTEEEVEAMTVAEIEGELDRLEIEYTSSWNKAQKAELLVGQPKE